MVRVSVAGEPHHRRIVFEAADPVDVGFPTWPSQFSAQPTSDEVHSSLIHPAGAVITGSQVGAREEDGSHLQPLCPGTWSHGGPGWEPSEDGVQWAWDEQPLLLP